MKKENKNSKKIVIAMSGGKDSIVAAYLLKKQGYECIGLGIDFFGEEFKEFGKYVIPEFYIKDLEEVKRSCDTLGIEFYGTNCQDLFEDEILGKITTSYLTGESICSQELVTKLMIKTLFDKAQLIGADSISTGHYVKIIDNNLTSGRSLYQNSDISYDESFLFSRIESKFLNNLICPLADLRKEDVENLAANLKIDYRKKVIKNKKNREKAKDVISSFINETVPKDLKRKGLLVNEDDSPSSGEHEGVYHFRIGDKYYCEPTGIEYDVIDIRPRENKVILGDLKSMEGDFVFLHDFNCSASMMKPFECFIFLNDQNEMIPGLLNFKNNNSVLIKFSKKIQYLHRNKTVCVYLRTETGAEMIGSGYVSQFGLQEELHRGNIDGKSLDKLDYKLDLLHF